MKRFLSQLICVVPLFAVAGCGATTEEQKPPEKAPELSAEEQQNMQKQIEESKKAYNLK